MGWMTKQVKENLQFISDLLALNIVHVFLLLLQDFLPHHLEREELLPLALTSNVIWVLLHLFVSPQVLNRGWSYSRHLAETVRLVCMQFVAMFLLNLLLFQESYAAMLPAYCILLLAVSAMSRFVLVWFLHTIRSRGYNFKRVVVIGNENLVASFAKEITQNVHYGYRLLGAFNEDLGASDSSNVPAPAHRDLYDFLIREHIDEVFISVHVPQSKVQSLMTFCQLNGIVINITHDFLNGLKQEPLNMSIRTGGISPTLTIREDWYAGMMRTDAKRLFDVLGAVLFLTLVASWLFPIIALLITLESRGPVFFRQRRSGLNNQVFWCLKFRTMRQNAESDTRQAHAGDERITRFGRILRTSNLDELPQFINVLIGDMSIVGPRPHMLKHTQEYGQLVDYYNERLWIKPGITGLAQSKGFRGEIREVSQLINRIYHDRYYVRNWTFLMDIKIILFTAWNMVSLQRMGV